MYVYKGEYARAESCYKELASCPVKADRSTGRYRLGVLLAYQGKLGDALRAYDDGMAADRMEGASGGAYGAKYGGEASIYLLRKDFDLAVREALAEAEAGKTVDSWAPFYGRDFYCYVLAQAGRVSEAQEVAEAIRKDIAGKQEIYMSAYWSLQAVIDMANKNTGAALTHLEKAVAADKTIISNYSYRAYLAQVYLEAGKLGEAVSTFEKVLSRYDELRVWSAPQCVEDHYLLGTAYEKSGWTGKAIEQYQEFLEIWQDADPGIPSVEDARRRLASLTGT